MIHAPVWMMLALGHLAPAVPQQAVPLRSPTLLGASLQVDLGAAAPRLLRAPRLLAENAHAPPRPEPEANAQTAPAPAAAQPEAPACGEGCDIDPEEHREAVRNSRYVRRVRERELRVHRAFGIASWGAMLITETLGTIQLVNQDTWFGRGVCSSDPNAFGCRQSSLITGLHQGFAFTTVGLYMTAGIIAISAPDPDNASVGADSAARTLWLHKMLAYVHGGGMILLPILGILSHYPQIVGVTSDEGRADFGRAMRSIHAIVGYTTFATLTVAGILEF